MEKIEKMEKKMEVNQITEGVIWKQLLIFFLSHFIWDIFSAAI